MVREDIDYTGLAERIKFVYCKNVAQRLLYSSRKAIIGFNPRNRRLILEAFSDCLTKVIELISDEMEYDYGSKELETILSVMGELLLRETIAVLGADVPIKCWQGMLNKSAFIVYEVVKDLIADQYSMNDIFKTAKIQAQLYFKRDLIALRDEKEFITNEQCRVALGILNIPMFLQEQERKKLHKNSIKKVFNWKQFLVNLAQTAFHYTVLIGIICYMVR